MTEVGSCQVKRELIQALSESQSKPESVNRSDSNGRVVLTQKGRTTGRTNCTSHASWESLLSTWVRISLTTGVDSAFMPLEINWYSRDLHSFQEWPLYYLEPYNQNPSNTCRGLGGRPKSDLHQGYYLKLSSPCPLGFFSPSLGFFHIPSTHSRSLYGLLGVPRMFFFPCYTLTPLHFQLLWNHHQAYYEPPSRSNFLGYVLDYSTL